MQYLPNIRKLILFSTILFVFNLKAQVNYISTDSLLSLINNSSEEKNTTVINFWATWCKPCVQELPYFRQADSILINRNVQFIFVSFDGPSEIKKVRKFSKSKNITGTQYILDATDLNNFINSVDQKWQGNIPYTILLKNNMRKNHENSFENLNELLLFINK